MFVFPDHGGHIETVNDDTWPSWMQPPANGFSMFQFVWLLVWRLPFLFWFENLVKSLGKNIIVNCFGTMIGFFLLSMHCHLGS